MSTVITLACLSALTGFVYWYIPRDRPRKWFRLEHFRPAAPLAGILETIDDRQTTREGPATTSPANQSSKATLD